MPANHLTIPESVLLLALNDETGERKGTYLNYALAGAALTELVLKGRLAQLDEPAKSLAIVSTRPVGDAYIDACLDAVIARGSDLKARTYIEHLGVKPSLPHKVYERLIERGIVSESKSKILFVTVKKYPEANPAPEDALKARLEKIISGTGPVDVRDAAIIALALHAGLLPHNFDAGLLKTHKARIKAISEGGLLPPNATKAVIDGMQAALVIATLIPVIVVAAN